MGWRFPIPDILVGGEVFWRSSYCTCFIIYIYCSHSLLYDYFYSNLSCIICLFDLSCLSIYNSEKESCWSCSNFSYQSVDSLSISFSCKNISVLSYHQVSDESIFWFFTMHSVLVLGEEVRAQYYIQYSLYAHLLIIWINGYQFFRQKLNVLCSWDWKLLMKYISL